MGLRTSDQFRPSDIPPRDCSSLDPVAVLELDVIEEVGAVASAVRLTGPHGDRRVVMLNPSDCLYHLATRL
jgi:hypothetical protein